MFSKQLWVATAFTISLLMAAAPVTQADSKEQAYKAIQSVYARMDDALNSKDIDTFYSFCTRDFVLISENGERKSVDDARNELSPMLKNPNIKSIKGSNTIEKFILDGDTATVFCKSTMTIAVLNPQTGSTNVVGANSRSLDTWVKQNGRWLMKQGETLTYEQTTNSDQVLQGTQPNITQQNIPPTMPPKPQQSGNDQSPLSKQTKNYENTPTEILHLPLPTERYFLIAPTGYSIAFNYPSSWYVQTNPPGIEGVISAQVATQMLQRSDMIVAPREDPRQATHYFTTSMMAQGVINPQQALQRWISQRFSGFRIVNSVTPQSQGVPGNVEIQGINVAYEASFQGIPVEGFLTVRSLINRDPLFGVSTIVSIDEGQLAKNLSKEKNYEYTFVLIEILSTWENNRAKVNEGIAKGMINTLGGVAEARDPSTGEVFTIPYNYKYAYRKGNERILTNDPTFKDPYATPLEIKSAHNR